MSGAVIISAAGRGHRRSGSGSQADQRSGRLPRPHLRQKRQGIFAPKRLAASTMPPQLAPWLVLVDLDHDAECALPFCRQWLPPTCSADVLSRGGQASRGVVAGRCGIVGFVFVGQT